MCQTVHALLQVVICGNQMLVRVFMTIILMIENLVRMILQTLYNFLSFLLQLISLIPICIVFLLTARLKCFMCGGGGPCPVNRGGACDCIMSALALVILFFIFRATGILDKIFYSIGYSKARIPVHRFVPTPGIITECSRNDTDYEYTEISTTLNATEELVEIYTSTIDLIELSSTTTDRFDTNSEDNLRATTTSGPYSQRYYIEKTSEPYSQRYYIEKTSEPYSQSYYIEKTSETYTQGYYIEKTSAFIPGTTTSNKQSNYKWTSVYYN